MWFVGKSVVFVEKGVVVVGDEGVVFVEKGVVVFVGDKDTAAGQVLVVLSVVLPAVVLVAIWVDEGMSVRDISLFGSASGMSVDSSNKSSRTNSSGSFVEVYLVESFMVVCLVGSLVVSLFNCSSSIREESHWIRISLVYLT